MVCFQVKHIELFPAYVIILTNPYFFLLMCQTTQFQNQTKGKLHSAFFWQNS